MQNCLPEGGFDKFDSGDLAKGKHPNILYYVGNWWIQYWLQQIPIVSGTLAFPNYKISHGTMINLCWKVAIDGQGIPYSMNHLGTMWTLNFAISEHWATYTWIRTRHTHNIPP